MQSTRTAKRGVKPRWYQSENRTRVKIAAERLHGRVVGGLEHPGHRNPGRRTLRLTRVKTPLCRLMCYMCRMNAGQII